MKSERILGNHKSMISTNYQSLSEPSYNPRTPNLCSHKGSPSLIIRWYLFSFDNNNLQHSHLLSKYNPLYFYFSRSQIGFHRWFRGGLPLFYLKELWRVFFKARRQDLWVESRDQRRLQSFYGLRLRRWNWCLGNLSVKMKFGEKREKAILYHFLTFLIKTHGETIQARCFVIWKGKNSGFDLFMVNSISNHEAHCSEIVSPSHFSNQAVTRDFFEKRALNESIGCFSIWSCSSTKDPLILTKKWNS